MTAQDEKTEVLSTTYRVRMSSADVTALRELALHESLRRGKTVLWTDLVRFAMRKMARDKTVVE
jgi:hypothetical protein